VHEIPPVNQSTVNQPARMPCKPCDVYSGALTVDG
jgi:hypothetical protein